MRVLAVSLLVLLGSAARANKPADVPDQPTKETCTDEGRVVYNPRRNPLNPLESPGPSVVKSVHSEGILVTGRQVEPRDPPLIVSQGHLWRCPTKR
jgi:hypothetical protein